MFMILFLIKPIYSIIVSTYVHIAHLQLISYLYLITGVKPHQLVNKYMQSPSPHKISFETTYYDGHHMHCFQYHI